MKRVLFYMLVTGLILGAGCSKKEEPAPAVINEKPAANPPPSLTQTTGTVATVAAKAQSFTTEAVQKADALKSALTVKPEQVMAELNQPIADIKTKVASLGQSELLATANAYKDAILAKKDQLAGLSAQLKELGMADILGEKGKAIKDQLSQYTSQLAGLKERYSVYLDMLKKFGVDLSAFGI